MHKIVPNNLEALVGDYQHAFTTGLQLFLVIAIVLLLGAVLAWFGLRSEPSSRKVPPVGS